MSTGVGGGRTKPTSRDVAALAGVSVATVSYVLNGKSERRVGADTRERVLAAAAELNYAPNQSARSLRRQRTQRVCLVIGSIGVPTYDLLSRDVHAAADEADYGVITMVVDSTARATRAIELLHQRIADGAVIATGEHILGPPALDPLARSGFPLVVRSNTIPPHGFDVVRAPERASCGEAMDHLFATGHRRIAFVGHRNEVEEVRDSERLGAYLDAHEQRGIEPDPRMIVTGADHRVDGYRAVSAMLASPDRPDAVFCASDRAGISGIWAARDLGLRVPEDVAIVGVGNIQDGLVAKPTLTTVGPTQADFTQVAELLFERVLAEDVLPGREITTPWAFFRRESA